MAYTHKEILAKHKKIHDKWLDELERLADVGKVKGTYAILGYVEREFKLICDIEDRMAAKGTAEQDKTGRELCYTDIFEEDE